MARIGRLAGALLAETRGAFFLVGDTKAPCDFAAEGFEPPGARDPRARPFTRLLPTRDVALREPVLVLDVEGEELARRLAERLLIARNGSVSERLWSLVLRRGEDDGEPGEGDVDARWLGAMPGPIWQIVRDTVLRCT